ncbi:DUF4148 domain-containing protein [Paraburkholderia elongata]|uniref:DUF4148 domain-containing protein n=1 Tax=Paraburkholderia elongata TaxID=2675747 RepID=A0A972NNP9_9BURK|nr:DUF4148 domain-containing protein [Paraburkholderia elongata]NPT56921.1 DUF4148 domain-containing protein [Paraburkholderia elongata]
MKSLASVAVAVAVLASPIMSFAATNGPVTRAEVRAQLVQLEKAGYNPSAGDDPHYPADIQAAEAKIAKQDGDRLAVDAVGGVAQAGSSQTGLAANAMSSRSLYAGH